VFTYGNFCPMRQPTDQPSPAAEATFSAHAGIMRTAEALAAGIHRRTLYGMRDEGLIEQLSRGVFHLASSPLPSQPDIVAVAERVPAGVICLVSALDFHGVTTQIPGAVDIALPAGVKAPRVSYPPLHVYHMSGAAMSEGVEEHILGRTTVRVFGLAKTIADCFKFRNTVGVNVAVEALQEAVRSRRVSVSEVVHYARLVRVARVMRPYLESLQ
jgi:predicted transcriptional regulator of viral defense system